MRVLRLVAIVAVLIVVVSSCSSSEPTSEPASSSVPAVPSASPSIDAATGVGDTVVITDDGFAPEWLLAYPGKPITFRNESASTWSVVFDHQNVRSGPIAPGATFTWTSETPISITYHAGNAPKVRGKIQVQSV
jgi:plastocyanin